MYLLIGIIAFVIIFVSNTINQNLDPDSSYDARQLKANNYLISKSKPFLWIGIIALIVLCFCPTSKQGYAIYGVGSTLDYVKNDSVAQELPPKVIKAIDKFLDEKIAEEKQEVSDCDGE